MKNFRNNSEMSALELKDEGNRNFFQKRYEDAINLYSQAINLCPTMAILYTNRALCYLKMKTNWQAICDDCRKALELDPNLLKGHFFLGLALMELANFDEAIIHLQRAFELSKEYKKNYGDEIPTHLRSAKKKRWEILEEKRIKEEILLHNYLIRLIQNDKENQLRKLREDLENKVISDEEFKTSEQKIISDIEERIIATNELFSQVDARRQKRDVPDYIFGKISFAIMHDPVITPSGITYDRKDISEHLQRVGYFDPISRQPLTANQLVPNLALKEVIDQFLKENPWAYEY